MTTTHNFEWPFSDAQGTPAVTTSHVTKKAMPIVQASRGTDEDGEITWQFHCALPFQMEDAQLVRLDSIVDLDHSVLELADLPLGFRAERGTQLDPWIYRKDTDA